MVPSVEALSTTMTSLMRIPLRQHRFQAALDEAAAVVGHDRDGDEVVLRHEQEPESPNFRTLCINPDQLGTGRNRFVPPAEQQTTAGEPHDFPVCRQGLQAPTRKPIPQHSAAASPLPPPDTPPGRRPGESAWLNISVNYDTNKSGASPLIGCEMECPPVCRATACRHIVQYDTPVGRRRQKSTSSNHSGKKPSSKPPNSSHTVPAHHQKRPRRLFHLHRCVDNPDPGRDTAGSPDYPARFG